MTSKTVIADAEVTISLKLHNLGSWGEECTVSQILRQAEEAAKTRAHKLLSQGTQANIKIGNITIKG
ncbi:hypothetical protein P7_133 [Pectobacterium phage vB_PcaM_P7_Pc]|nr:hypothetical protein P7_133 [Pectobacterium phage vB_PcaM_P7_Pc]